MDVYVGFIAALPYTFAPQGWAACDGSSVAVSSNSALFSLLGTQFGGDGITTFKLPDLRGRTIIGSGSGPGLTPYNQGENGGFESITLSAQQMPTHSHAAAVAGGGTVPVTGTISATLNVGTIGGDSNPGGNFIAASAGGSGEQIFTTAGGATANAGSVTVTPNLTAAVNNLTVTVGMSGGSLPHENRMPYLAIQYCIATQGLYPSRP